MKQRINITISEDVLETTKKIARNRKSTVSALIETELRKLGKQASNKKSFLQLLKEAPEPNYKYPEDFDFKQEYMKDKLTP